MGSELPGTEQQIVQPRIVPSDLFDAAVRVQQGQLVDVSPHIPLTVGETESFSFRLSVQKALDRLVRITTSPDYARFQRDIAEIVSHVRDQDFLFDIEGTVLNDVQNTGDLQQRVFYVIPHMQSLVTALINNGNRIGFLTSVPNEVLTNMRRAMGPEMRALPGIARDNWGTVVTAYNARANGQMTDEQVLKTLRATYPSANQETYLAGKNILNGSKLASFNDNPVRFLRRYKFPQIFIPRTTGFFVDDDEDYITPAVDAGWPAERAIKCDYEPREDNVREVAQEIASAAT